MVTESKPNDIEGSQNGKITLKTVRRLGGRNRTQKGFYINRTTEYTNLEVTEE